MSRNSTPVQTLSIKAIAVLIAHRFISVTGGVPAAGANSYGVNRSSAAIDGYVPVDSLGTTTVEAGGVIAPGGLIECDNVGRAVAAAAGAVLARLAPGEPATASGDFVEVVLIPN